MEWREVIGGIRFILAFLFTAIVSLAVAFFVALGGTINDLQTLIGDVETAKNWGIAVLSILVVPYQFAKIGSYAPLASYIVGGFIGGLISKKPARGMIAAALVVLIYFVIYIVLVATTPALQTLKDIAIDLVVTLVIALISSGFGAMFTEK